MGILWLVLAAIGIFMFLFTATNISGNSASFLAIGWFVVFVVTSFEAGSLYRASRHKPTRKERTTQYWEERKKKRRG